MKQLNLFDMMTNNEYFEEKIQKPCDKKGDNLAAPFTDKYETYICKHTKNIGKCCIIHTCPKMKERE